MWISNLYLNDLINIDTIIVIITCIQVLSIIMESKLIDGYSIATSSQHSKNNPSANFL